MAWESVPGNDAGTMNGDGSRKLLLHSTEGSTVEGAVGAYRKNNSWPTFTIDCPRRRVVRHLADTVAARSLRNRSGGVETNRDGTVLIQLELVGFAGTPDSIGDRDDLVWLGTEVVGPLCRRNSIPLGSSVRWAPYPASYGVNATQRLTAGAWDGYSGVLGHQHAPENDHGDPGAIDIDLILSAARGDDMVTPEQMAELKQNTRDELRRALQFLAAGEGNTLTGGQDWADEALTLPDLLAEFGRPGSKPRLAMQEMSRRGINWSLGANAANDDQGLLKARLDAIEATLAEIGAAVAPSVPPAGAPDVPPPA